VGGQVTPAGSKAKQGRSRLRTAGGCSSPYARPPAGGRQSRVGRIERYGDMPPREMIAQALVAGQNAAYRPAWGVF
jgi:hypothetical protein